jgi:AraC family transcriptional regulator, arabinose operon regulatory protein
MNQVMNSSGWQISDIIPIEIYNFVPTYIYYLTVIYLSIKMQHIREGIKGQRLITLTTEIINNAQYNSITKNLFIKKIGFNPPLKFHHIEKDKGVDYFLLFYCVAGEGWYSIGGKSYKLNENEYFILPPDTPYRYGANPKNPWSSYWIQFSGEMASHFYKFYIAREIIPDINSRLQDRIQLFEEIYSNLELSYHSEHYIYSSICLTYFLGSFAFPVQFSRIRSLDISNYGISEKAIHFMRENVEHNLSLGQIASHFNLSVSRFSALFQKKTKQSPIKYFISLKMEKACQYLELTNLKIAEIYPRLGFQNSAYFSKMFIKTMGISPTKYRERERFS